MSQSVRVAVFVVTLRLFTEQSLAVGRPIISAEPTSQLVNDAFPVILSVFSVALLRVVLPVESSEFMLLPRQERSPHEVTLSDTLQFFTVLCPVMLSDSTSWFVYVLLWAAVAVSMTAMLRKNIFFICSSTSIDK